MRASTWPASPRCTGCCGPQTRSASAAPRPPTRPGSARSYSPTAPNQVWSLGYHETERPAARRVLRPVRDARHFLPKSHALGGTRHRERGELAEAFIDRAVASNGGIAPRAIHADRGTSMTSKPVAALLSDLHITQSHSRPHVSQRQPVQRGAVQDPQVLPGVPRQVRVPARRPRLLRASSSPTTTTSTGIPGIGLHTHCPKVSRVMCPGVWFSGTGLRSGGMLIAVA